MPWLNEVGVVIAVPGLVLVGVVLWCLRGRRLFEAESEARKAARVRAIRADLDRGKRLRVEQRERAVLVRCKYRRPGAIAKEQQT